MTTVRQLLEQDLEKAIERYGSDSPVANMYRQQLKDTPAQKQKNNQVYQASAARSPSGNPSSQELPRSHEGRLQEAVDAALVRQAGMSSRERYQLLESTSPKKDEPS